GPVVAVTPRGPHAKPFLTLVLKDLTLHIYTPATSASSNSQSPTLASFPWSRTDRGGERSSATSGSPPRGPPAGRPHAFLGGLLLPPLLRVAGVGQLAAAVGRAAAQLALAVGRQRVVGRVLLVAGRRAGLVGGRGRPGVVGGAARAEPRAQPGRRLEAAAAAGALGPGLALPRAPARRVLVLGRRARRAAHQARQGRVVGRPPARGAVGPGALRVAGRLAAAAPRPVGLLQRAVLVEASQRPRLRALEAAPAPGLVAVAVGPAGPLAVGVGEGRQLVHGDGRHAGGEVLPRQHLGFGSLLAAGGRDTAPAPSRPAPERPFHSLLHLCLKLSRSSLLYSMAEGPRLAPLLPPMTPDQ
uniref:Uncharacterized protein n=1 Tax=Equus caballus TaxID=9796 RepID=A0A9L0RK17_HORSE